MWITGLPAGEERYADQPVGVLVLGQGILRNGSCGIVSVRFSGFDGER